MNDRSLQASQGCVFNIQRYSVHDGPGIRTIVFLKGCPLACRWCSNPESQQGDPELAYNNGKCIGMAECALCREACPRQGITFDAAGKAALDRDRCGACFRCADACPAKALHVFGRTMTVAEVMREVEADGVFYARSGGGLTLSGGEPLAQSGFAVALLKEAKRRRLNTSMETCGLAPWEELAAACRHLDTIIYDIKCIDAEKHEAFTGVSNEPILANFARLCEEFPTLPKLVRTPVIPGINDSEADIGAVAAYLAGRPGVEYELLAYHRLGRPKYKYLGREYPLGDETLDEDKMKALKQLARERLGN